jgi:hypothetical protein
MRLRLLALVLALALTWYAINPAPGSMNGIKRDEGWPDEKRREEKPPSRIGYDFGGKGASMTESDADPVPEDLEWPELIDVS